ncbi:hypothetical protein ACFWVC_21725 [Streptomyces sp. NPDC058691]|uniref:hypothetical protein n=1 Tax=Streptomyces sp. NPDC058691 TaxID=3346601 RepID=UPI00366610F6
MPEAAGAPRIAEPETIHHPEAWAARTSEAVAVLETPVASWLDGTYWPLPPARVDQLATGA